MQDNLSGVSSNIMILGKLLIQVQVSGKILLDEENYIKKLSSQALKVHKTIMKDLDILLKKDGSRLQ